VEVTIAVQIGGRLRATVTVPVDSEQVFVENAAMAEPNVKKHTDGQAIKKIIYVPDKILNIIVQPR
jgi:leucyl-tRNA synthetase